MCICTHCSYLDCDSDLLNLLSFWKASSNKKSLSRYRRFVTVKHSRPIINQTKEGAADPGSLTEPLSA